MRRPREFLSYLHSIADFVEAGEAVAEIETPDGQRLPVVTQISGILRGLLRDGYPVNQRIQGG